MRAAELNSCVVHSRNAWPTLTSCEAQLDYLCLGGLQPHCCRRLLSAPAAARLADARQ